jgi:hypothetical protein
MDTRDRRPAWWQLYLLGLVMIGLLVLGAWAPLSVLGHQVAAIGALLLAYGLVALWLHANRPALLRVSKLLLAQQPDQKTVRETFDEEQVPVYISWRLPPEIDRIAGGNGDQRAEQAAEATSAPAGTRPS